MPLFAINNETRVSLANNKTVIQSRVETYGYNNENQPIFHLTFSGLSRTLASDAGCGTRTQSSINVFPQSQYQTLSNGPLKSPFVVNTNSSQSKIAVSKSAKSSQKRKQSEETDSNCVATKKSIQTGKRGLEIRQHADSRIAKADRQNQR